jgi:ABC-type dipeptide/oligopeptide/nickel transport system permease component
MLTPGPGRALEILSLRGYGPFVARRIVGFIPLLIGITLIAFLLIRLLPGDPARVLAGNTPYEGTVEQVRRHFGLDKPLLDQYLIYVQRLLQGDLGQSYVTGTPVTADFARRLPATIELITIGMIGAIVFGMILGIRGALRPRGLSDRVSQVYGSLAGSIPDFGVALLVVLVLFYYLHWIPPPLSRFPMAMTPPPTVTGFLTIDSILAFNGDAFVASTRQLIGPVLCIVFLNTPLIAKFTRSAMDDVLESDFIRFARGCGLPNRVVARYAVRNILPPLITMMGFLYTFLVGGAVLIESIFSWPGIGAYAVSAVSNRDYVPLQGFIVLMGAISLIVYLVVDIAYMIVDPRVRIGSRDNT